MLDLLPALTSAIARAAAEGQPYKWPDAPGGPVACGQAAFVTGHLGRSGGGRHNGD